MRLEKKKNIALSTSFIPDVGQCGRSAGVPDEQPASVKESQLSAPPFVGGNWFQPATLAVMVAAFDAAWHKLRSSGYWPPSFAPVRPAKRWHYVSLRRRGSASVMLHGLAMQRWLTPGALCSIRGPAGRRRADSSQYAHGHTRLRAGLRIAR